ncbi:uncharacterized protein LOC114470770 [Gouania willdenowi]|uniref:uncharacterized protein LOC114470770 n=1 Tax=Gouania willdenowi TaxID=441366 RepID=UPI00105595C2|nr:uncharacterized protein LOC114470770 [Gouania willdenowi]
MTTRNSCLYFFLIIACVDSTCIPFECLRCNDNETLTETCMFCLNSSQCINEILINLHPQCKKDFLVLVNSSGSVTEEGDDITLTCVHNLPDPSVTFEWRKDGNKIQGGNESRLTVEGVLSYHSGQYQCSVNSSCGAYTSLPHDVTVNNSSVVLLVVCGVAAVVLLLIMGLIMKYKLKRDNAKHKERMKQRAVAAQSAAPPPSCTPRES